MGYYDIAQICSNGHMVNDSTRSSPQFNENHCSQCGAKTTTVCQECKASIKGDYKGEVVVIGYSTPTPTHCHECGKPYPWKAKVEKSAKEIKKKKEAKSISDWWKNTFIGGSILAILGAIGYLGNFWEKLPQEWRTWMIENIPQVEIRLPMKDKTPQEKSSKAPK